MRLHASQGNQRSKQRYPIDFSVHYKVLTNSPVIGSGKTIDMSNKGIAFTSEDTLKIGTYVELNVSWPVILYGSCPMNVVFEGRVVRSDGPLTAIRIDRYEFRLGGGRLRDVSLAAS